MTDLGLVYFRLRQHIALLSNCAKVTASLYRTMNKDILLCTLNSTYQHTAFGLRYLFAQMEELQERTEILEFTINQNTKDIVEILLKKKPKVIGFGIYIWNIEETFRLLTLLKSIAPEIKIVVGGPEVSHETESQKVIPWVDHVVKGEADFLFAQLCRDLLNGNSGLPKIISGELPEVKKIKSPYSLYSDHDIATRIIYVEASRGCPYKCEYCLSSLDKAVRNFELTSFLLDMENLIQRGARQFKFVDRTFNLSPSISCQILKFFLDRVHLGLFLHFEMVPDRLPDELKELIEKFPSGSLQFEIGIQTFSTVVAAHVSRRQDYKKIRENFHYLKEKTLVHTHADLIVGLPGETLESFEVGFNTLVEFGPDEIQVGILKRLKGFPLARHDQAFQMKYDLHPPFQILQNKEMSFEEIQVMQRFAKTWDQVANSGNFPRLMAAWKTYLTSSGKSLFKEILALSSFLHQRHSQNYGISLLNLVESLWVYFQNTAVFPITELAEVLGMDYAYQKRRDLPYFLRTQLNAEFVDKIKNSNRTGAYALNSAPDRQQRHLAQTPAPRTS